MCGECRVKRLLAGFALAASVGVGAAEAQSAAEVERHVAAAKAAAGTDHAGMVQKLCPPPAAPAAVSKSWHAEPVTVFDNLHFVGMTQFSAWAVTTSQGIIVIDPVFDYSVEDAVVGGLETLGIKPGDIKYVLISHGHLDHAGGAKLLQERYGARLVMAAADWDLVEKQNPPWKPKRDMVATDGQKLTLGDTTLTLYLTPGHTDGTISTLIPLRDGRRSHLAALWGGTLFNFGPDRRRFTAYRDSAERFREIVTKAGADVLLSNHTEYDGTDVKLPMLKKRRPGDPHPFVIGNDSVRRYLTVANECAQAALAGL